MLSMTRSGCSFWMQWLLRVAVTSLPLGERAVRSSCIACQAGSGGMPCSSTACSFVKRHRRCSLGGKKPSAFIAPSFFQFGYSDKAEGSSFANRQTCSSCEESTSTIPATSESYRSSNFRAYNPPIEWPTRRAMEGFAHQA